MESRSRSLPRRRESFFKKMLGIHSTQERPSTSSFKSEGRHHSKSSSSLTRIKVEPPKPMARNGVRVTAVKRAVTFQDDPSNPRDLPPMAPSQNPKQNGIPKREEEKERRPSGKLVVELKKLNNSLGLSIVSQQVRDSNLMHSIIFLEPI